MALFKLTGKAVELAPTIRAWSQRFQSLTLGQSWGLLLAFALVIQLSVFVYNLFFHPLAKFPGPMLARCSGLPKLFQLCIGNDVPWMRSLHDRYGPVVRLSPSELSFVSYSAYRDVQSGDRATGGRPVPINPIYGLSEKDMFGEYSILWIVDHDEHNRHRKAVLSAFSARAIRDHHTPVLDHYSDLFLRRLLENAAAGQTVDLLAWFTFASFDIIAHMMYDEPFGCLEESRFHPWIHFIFTRLRFMLLGQILAGLGWVGRVVQVFTPKHIRDDIAWNISVTKDKVDRRRAKEGDGVVRHDVLSYVLPKLRDGEKSGMTTDTAKSDGLSLDELYANGQTLTIAGSETTATLMGSTAFQLAKNPSKLAKLRSEFGAAFQGLSPAEIKATFDNLTTLPYFNAVLNESLRIQHPIPTGIHRHVSLDTKSPTVVDGHVIPPGTHIAIYRGAMNRSAFNYSDPDEFVPERWLGDDRYRNDKGSAFQPFGLGPRACIGKHLALVEARRLVGLLVWNFEIELLPDSVDWEESKIFLVYEKTPLNVRLTPIDRSTQGMSGSG